MGDRANQGDVERRNRIADESAALYKALASVVDQDVLTRLFPLAWRELQRIRAGPQRKKRHILLPVPLEDVPH